MTAIWITGFGFPKKPTNFLPDSFINCPTTPWSHWSRFSSFQISQISSRFFCPKPLAHKESISFLTLQTMDWRAHWSPLQEAKNTVGVGWWCSANRTYLFKAYVLKIFFIEISNSLIQNRHILEWNIQLKGTMLIAVEESTNAPPPGRGFLTNGPTKWEMHVR